MRRFDGKRYWLVGASEGLGRALAHALARKGAEVIVSARDAERLNALAAEIGEGASAVTIDIADDESVEKAAKEVGRQAGGHHGGCELYRLGPCSGPGRA